MFKRISCIVGLGLASILFACGGETVEPTSTNVGSGDDSEVDDSFLVSSKESYYHVCAPYLQNVTIDGVNYVVEIPANCRFEISIFKGDPDADFENPVEDSDIYAKIIEILNI